MKNVLKTLQYFCLLTFKEEPDTNYSCYSLKYSVNSGILKTLFNFPCNWRDENYKI